MIFLGRPSLILHDDEIILEQKGKKKHQSIHARETDYNLSGLEHFHKRVPYTPLHCKIDSLKNIGAFHASRTNIDILSRSHKNRSDHVSRRNKRNSRINTLSSSNQFRLLLTL